MRMGPCEAVYFPGPPRFATDALILQLRDLLAERVDAAYLFGSHARGTANEDSDVDLIVVAESQEPWPRRAEAFADLWSHFGPVDVLVYTPREWQDMHASNHPFIAATSQEWVSILPTGDRSHRRG